MALRPSPKLRRWLMAWLLLAGAALSGGCGHLWMWDHAGAQDADEGYAVWQHVKSSGTVPESASGGRSQTRSRRFVLVVGVEDPATQDRILEAATEARRLYSTKPVVVVFSAGTVVKGRDGGATFPDGTIELRRETVPPDSDGDATVSRIVAPPIRDRRSAVAGDVRESGAVPPGGEVWWKESTLFVTGVEGAAAQDAIVAAARDARARHAAAVDAMIAAARDARAQRSSRSIDDVENAVELDDVFRQVVFERLDATYAPDGRASVEKGVIRTVTLDCPCVGAPSRSAHSHVASSSVRERCGGGSRDL